jgi:hypothetical protein
VSFLLYRGLVYLHPAAFRRQFGSELLVIFEDAVVADGAAALLFDVVVSLLRQWLLRSGLWKAGVAVLGAAVQVIPALMMATRHARVSQIVPARGAPIEADGLVAITVFMVCFVAAMLVAVVFWSIHVARLAAKRR